MEVRFWPLNDPEKAGAILIGLLDSKPMRLTAESAARERFGRDFDVDIVAPRLLSFLIGTTTRDWKNDLAHAPEFHIL